MNPSIRQYIYHAASKYDYESWFYVVLKYEVVNDCGMYDD